MRELKFRAWNGKEFFRFDIYNMDRFPMLDVQQFTGLRDRNGKDIYEGDIIKQEYAAEFNTVYDPATLGFVESESDEGDHVGEVVIIASKGVCMRKPLRYSVGEEKPTVSNQYKDVSAYRCEVIGNIHENPDLLKAN